MAGVLLSAAVACVLLAGAVSASSSPRVFTVGGVERGWRQPAPGEETYNHWATKNRFHVGDFLHFRYDGNDSVLVVTRDDYKRCGTDRPVLRLEGGEARFRLERSGFLYFISGAPGHCDAGQRFTLRVMAERDNGGGGAPPTEAPAMPPGGPFNSTPGSGSGGSARMPPRGNAGDGKTSGAARAAPLGGYHAVGAALGVGVGAAVLVFA
ncbi:early nodulin-like protein 1 [Hordeum vulgare subsp. vulgare]|uniref:Phytocyanin domain-containing protein n=1 Tax=Hordeum vulgare subsp. vulgare TaxID=112509 RepID=A0A8I6Z1I8_HORVV|nr:early nodulin-like protein 1 [Hordeum vulgare subsp. vulgare]